MRSRGERSSHLQTDLDQPVGTVRQQRSSGKMLAIRHVPVVLQRIQQHQQHQTPMSVL